MDDPSHASARPPTLHPGKDSETESRPSPTAPTAAFDTNPQLGILLKVLSVTLFVTMFACIKAVGEVVPLGETVFFRSLFALPPILLWVGLRGGFPGRLKTRDPLGHLKRGLAGVAAMSLGFFALALLPLPEVVAIGYAAPLFATLFAAVLLGERLRVYRLAAIALGLVGVLLVLSPHLGLFDGDGAAAASPASASASSPKASSGVTSSAGAPSAGTSSVLTALGSLLPQTIGALAALLAAVLSAFAQVFARGLVRRETTVAIAFWFTITSTMLSLATLPFGWTLPSPGDAALLVVAGLLGGTGQILLTESYRHAELAVIAPFDYTSILLSLGIGYVVFGESPTVTMLAGAALVVLAGLVILHRERRLGLARAPERAKARAAGPTQG